MRFVTPINQGAPVTSIRLLRHHLNLPKDDPTDDFVLARYLLAAQTLIVEELGCPLTTQTFEEIADRATYPVRSGLMQLWMRPVQSILEVASINDTDGVTETLLTNAVDYQNSRPVGLVFPQSWTWPTRRMRIRYVAGWPVDRLPAPLQIAVLMVTADLYANRESVDISDGRAVAVVNPTAERMTRSYRRFN